MHMDTLLDRLISAGAIRIAAKRLPYALCERRRQQRRKNQRLLCALVSDGEKQSLRLITSLKEVDDLRDQLLPRSAGRRKCRKARRDPDQVHGRIIGYFEIPLSFFAPNA